MKLGHWFLPHPETHKKAHLLSWYGLVSYIFLFILLQVGFSFLTKSNPGVLGITSNVSQAELITLTNAERSKSGLDGLKEDPRLNAAALAKGQNMFAENYWAHYSPSGKDPWGFILGAGYKFSVAGENLARNFYNSPDVVKAWMDSPTHRANILNSRYQDIGMAVLEGVLNGQQTILVVQEFGTEAGVVAKAPTVKKQEVVYPVATPGVKLRQRLEQALANQPTRLLGVSVTDILIDQYMITKMIGFGLIGMLALLLIIDWVVIHKRAVSRISSRHIPHLAMLGVAASALAMLQPGQIL